jgi:CheY-like chemotaxis protein
MTERADQTTGAFPDMDGTVLVADDDRTIRTVLTQALTRAGCKVHATSSLMTLMRWVEEGKGDLVISDVVMPDGNGLETLPEDQREAPRPAGDRDLGAEHDHDGDPGGGGRRLRLPAQALRPARPDEARRPALEQKRRAAARNRPEGPVATRRTTCRWWGAPRRCRRSTGWWRG